MAARYGRINDLLWADDGDFVLQPQIRTGELGIPTGGDFADTKALKLRGWLQRVKTRLHSATQDWKYLGIGANLGNFISAKNTKETGDAIRERIINELTIDGLCYPQELRVEVVPLTPSYIGVVLAVRPPGSNQDVIITHGIGLRDTDQQIMREA